MSEKAFHRFRSTNALLDGFHELENQEIYFASPEELNDPMEGYKDIFWYGDEVVWENFMKHYMLCLEQACFLFVIGGASLDGNNISVFMTEERFPTSQYKELFKEICDTFFNNGSISEYIKYLSTRSTRIRRNELFVYIKSLHFYTLETIFTVYEKHNMIQKREDGDIFRQQSQKMLLNMEALNNINKTKEELSGIEQNIDLFWSDVVHTYVQIQLAARYHESTSNDQKNKMFIYSDFPEAYIQKVETIVYPDWYAACFMTEYSNSSVWGHYGDHHKGVCLSFKAIPENDITFISLLGIHGWGKYGPIFDKIKHVFYKIIYDKKYVEVDFFKSLGRLPVPILLKYWYMNEKGSKSICADDVFRSEEQWRGKYWASFYKGITIKLKDWEYENEYRLILYSSLFDFSDSKSRKLKYDFNDLESITFGIKTPIEDKLKIIAIIESKCRKENRSDFKFYQAHYSEQKGSIDRFEINLVKFASSGNIVKNN